MEEDIYKIDTKLGSIKKTWEYIECPICRGKFKCLYSHIRAYHKISAMDSKILLNIDNKEILKCGETIYNQEQLSLKRSL